MKTGSTNFPIICHEDCRAKSDEFIRRVSEEPFKSSAFINALLFLCHTSGLKLFPGGSVLLRPSSNAGLHSRYLLQPSTNAGPLSEPQCRNVSELQRRTMSKLQSRTISEIQRRTISEVSYHLRSKSRRSLAELNVGNALYGASHWRPSFMPDCFQGGAPPRLRANFLSIFLICAIYSPPRYIASSPQGVYRSKTQDAPKG